MRPVTSEAESDQDLAVLAFPRHVLVIMYSRAQVPSHVYIYVCVCMPVAVYKTHVELQIKIHTLVYICTYKHTEGINTISPKYCILSKNSKENIFNIYS